MTGRLLLFSVVVGAVLIPLYASRDSRPVRGLRRTFFWGLAFNAAWWFAALYVYPRV